MIRPTYWLGLAAMFGAAAPAARAQLSLRQALQEADRGAYANRAAAGTADAVRAQRLAPLKGILPSARLEAGYVRTTDPVGAFGTTLRQRAVTPAAFDPQRLNYPAAVGNYQAGVVAEVPLLNADAWAGRQRAADAGTATAEWTRLATRTDVIRAYYGAVLAAERVATLETAARAAHSHVAQAQSMVRNGLVTKSDALLASVRAADVDALLAEARGGASIARNQLAMVLGRDPGRAVSIAPTLPAIPHLREIAAPDTALDAQGPRLDVQAASFGAEAARADALRARATLLPRINGIARYDWNSLSGPYTGARNWTVGVMASWNLFGGASELADIKAAAGREAAARAGAEGAVASARLQAEQTRTALAVALTRLQIGEQSTTQSAEAHRLVEKRYGGGLATVTELLDAQAVETQSALALTQARYAVIAAAAEHRQAIGADPGALAALDDAAPAVATAPAAASAAASPH